MATITIVAGADWTIKYDWDTVDITGYKFYHTVKRHRDQTDANAAESKDGTATGTSIELTYTGAETALLDGTYYADCKVVDTSGNKVIIPTTGPDTLVVVKAATLRSS